MSIWGRFKNLWAGSIQRQLIVGIAAVHAVMMTLFVADLVLRQTEFLRNQTIGQATSLAETLAANSTSWVLSSDVVGLEEVVRSQASYPSLQYALIHDLEGKVLGYSDRQKVGDYIDDSMSRSLLGRAAEAVILLNNDDLVDVGVPIIASGTQIGWARVGLGRGEIAANLNIITRDGVLYMVAAIIVGTLFAYFMGLGLTRGVRGLVSVTDSMRHGNYNTRAKEDRADELGKLAKAFNEMNEIIRNREDELKGMNSQLEDLVTARTEKLEATLNELRIKQQEVLQSEKLSAIGGMVAGFAHELNNPLMGLGAYIDAIRGSSDPSARSPEVQEAIEKAGKIVERLMKIVQSILHHTVVHEFAFTEIALSESVDETIHLFRAGAMVEDLTINVDISDDLPPIWGDVNSLQQILLNIMLNARDAMNESENKLIEISATANETDVSISITDTGSGIPDEILNKIFEPFFTNKAPGKGTGLGLSVSNDLILNIKGSMQCRNRPEGGAEFIVTVPIYKADQ